MSYYKYNQNSNLIIIVSKFELGKLEKSFIFMVKYKFGVYIHLFLAGVCGYFVQSAS